MTIVYSAMLVGIIWVAVGVIKDRIVAKGSGMSKEDAVYNMKVDGPAYANYKEDSK